MAEGPLLSNEKDVSKFVVSSEPPAPKEVTAPPVEVTEKPKEEVATTEKPTEPAKPEVTPLADDDLVKILTERGLPLKSLDDIKSAIAERQALQEKVKELANKKPEFTSDKAKVLYEFANKFDDDQKLAAAKTYLNLVGLDLSKSDSKTKQFEAFALENPDLPRDRAKVIFDAKYEKEYGDGNFEGDPLKEYEHEKATQRAQQAIEQAVKGWNEAKSATVEEPEFELSPEEERQIQLSIDASLKNAVKVNYPEYKTKVGATIPAGNVDVALNADEAAKVRFYMANPEKLIEAQTDVLFKFDQNKNLDYTHLRDAITRLLYPDKFYGEVRSQSIEQALLAMINQSKNNGEQKLETSDSQGPVKKTWSQAFNERVPVN